MVIILNSDGTAQIVSSTSISQGSNLSSRITVIGPSMAQTSVLEIGFKLPTGEIMQ